MKNKFELFVDSEFQSIHILITSDSEESSHEYSQEGEFKSTLIEFIHAIDAKVLGKTSCIPYMCITIIKCLYFTSDDMLKYYNKI